MKTLIASALAAIAVVGTIALVPASSWIFKNQIDNLLRVDHDNPAPYDDNFEVFTPKWLLDPQTYSGTDRDEQLAHALLMHSTDRLTALDQFAKDHPGDVLAWTLVVRRAAMFGARSPDYSRAVDANQTRDVDRSLALGIAASRRAENLEPGNAYFPLMRAAFLLEGNHLEDMKAALKDAAGKPRFDNHVREEGQTMNQAILKAKGYRGELLRVAFEASILLPDLSHVKSMARYLNRHGTLEEKRDLIQADYLLAKGESTIVGFLVAYAQIRYAVRPPMPLQMADQKKPTDAELLSLASNFDDKLKRANVKPPVPGTLAVYQTLSRLVAASQLYMRNEMPRFPSTQETTDDANAAERRVFLQTVLPSWGLLNLLFAGLIGFFCCLSSLIKSDAVRTMVPYFLGIPAWLISVLLMQSCNDCGPIPYMGALFGGIQISLALLRFGKPAATISTGVIAAAAILFLCFSPTVLTSLAIAAMIVCIGITAASWLLSPEQRIMTAKIGGALVAVAGIMSVKSDQSAILGGVAYFIVWGCLAKNKNGVTPKFLTVLSIVLIVLFAGGLGAVATWQILFYRPIAGYEFSAVAAVLVSTLFVGKSLSTAKVSTCIGLVLFTALYVASVGWQLRGNNEMLANKRTFLYEADNIRALASVKPG